jgi:hypothetical protein
MTEAEWLACTNPAELIPRSRKGVRLSTRKVRLLCCAALRRVWHLLTVDGKRSIEIAEHFADGRVDEQELLAKQVSIYRGNWADNGAHYAASSVQVFRSFARVALRCAIGAASQHAAYPNEARKFENLEREAQLRLIRDILHNPFRPVLVDRAWLEWNDGTVRRIAQAIYDERAFDRMPILADALEDAGCDNADILNHCRSGGEHVRGCWVVDLLLGKS